MSRDANETDLARDTPLAVEIGRSLRGKGPLTERSLSRTSQRRLSGLLRDDLDLVLATRVNLLLMGQYNVTRDVLEALAPCLRQPVIVAYPGEPLVLPPLEQVGTMILHDVGTLAVADQGRLLDWLDGVSGGPQVISTTPSPLLALIKAGAFLETLYYRLNSLYVEVTPRWNLPRLRKGAGTQ